MWSFQYCHRKKATDTGAANKGALIGIIVAFYEVITRIEVKSYFEEKCFNFNFVPSSLCSARGLDTCCAFARRCFP